MAPASSSSRASELQDSQLNQTKKKQRIRRHIKELTDEEQEEAVALLTSDTNRSSDIDVKIKEDVKTVETVTTSTSASSISSTSTFSSKSPPLTFDHVMIDECMSLMLQFTSRRSRFSQMVVSKVWRSAIRHHSTWRNETLNYTKRKSPSRWLRRAVGGMRIKGEQLTYSLCFSLFPPLNHLRRLTLVGSHNRDQLQLEEQVTFDVIRAAFQRLRLQEFEVDTHSPNTIWRALFQQANSEKNESEEKVDDSLMIGDADPSQQPAIWSWCESLVKLTLHTGATQSKVASIFRTFAARVWSRLDSLYWFHYSSASSSHPGVSLTEFDWHEFQQFLTPHCLPSITSIDSCVLDIWPSDDGINSNGLETTALQTFRVNLPTLTSFRGGVRLAGSTEHLALELAPSILTRLELNGVSELCQLQQFTQLREFVVTESEGFRWNGSWLSFFECIGSHVLPHLESLGLPSTVNRDNEISALNSSEEKRLSEILSQMTQLTSLNLVINGSGSWTESHWIEYVHLLPSLANLTLLSDINSIRLPEQQVRDSLISAISGSTSLEYFRAHGQPEILTVNEWRRVAQLWSGLKDSQVKQYRLKMGQSIIPLSVDHRDLLRTNAIHTLDLTLPYKRKCSCPYCTDPSNNEHDEKEDVNTRKHQNDDEDLTWIILQIASMQNLTSLSIFRLHADIDDDYVHNPPCWPNDSSYLVQLVRLEHLTKLCIHDDYYRLNNQIIAHWTRPGHFSRLREISLQLSNAVTSTSVLGLIRLPQLLFIEFVTFPESQREAMSCIVQAANEFGRKPQCRMQLGYSSRRKVDKFFHASGAD